MKNQNHLPKELSAVLILRPKNDLKAKIVEKKTQTFRKYFYLKEKKTDLSNILKARYPQSIKISKKYTEDEAANLIRKLAADKIPRLNKFPNRFLKALSDSFVARIISLINACWEYRYYPKRFKEARTIALKKEKK